MTRTEKIAVSILRPINPSLVIVLGLYTIIWGLWIINPWTDVFGAAALYSVMANLANEYVWGAIAVSAGLAITHGALRPDYRNLRLGAFIGFFHWFVISLMYFAGDVVNTGGITALTFAIYSGILWLNIKVNSTHYKRAQD